MTYFETELLFTPEAFTDKNPAQNSRAFQDKRSLDPSEILGITLRLGNRPLVYNLNDLCRRSGKPVRLSDQDQYLVIHSIAALRTKGRARVDELQYLAEAVDPKELQTVDLVPKTRFNEVLRAGLKFNGCIDLFGEVSMDISSVMMDQLLDEFADLAPGIKIQFSTSVRFIGNLVYTLQIPIVQASGIGSDTCFWILKPDENKTPLLGDQLLIQSIAVPKGTSRLIYTISGLVKADKGVFWKQQEKKTADYIIEVDLSHVNSLHT